MNHYLVELKTITDLQTEFPHSPNNDLASFAEYLEDRAANGWKLSSFSDASSGFWFVFTPDTR